MAQEVTPAQPDGQVQQMHWLEMREMQLANLHMQTQMQANMQAQIERLAEQQARRVEELRIERERLDALYWSAMDVYTRQSAGLQQSGPAATTMFRSMIDEPGALLTADGGRRTVVIRSAFINTPIFHTCSKRIWVMNMNRGSKTFRTS